MMKPLEYILQFKMKALTELGGISGFGTTLFVKITGISLSVSAVTLHDEIVKTIILSLVGGIVGAIGGLLVAVIWYLIKKALKKWFNIHFEEKSKL